MIRHSPGPWVFPENGDYIRDGRGHWVAHGLHSRGPREDGLGMRECTEIYANERLIAAAPEMLEALKAANDALRCSIDYRVRGEDCVCVGCTAADKVRAAIVKSGARS